MDIKVKNDIVSPVKINKFGLYDLQDVSKFEVSAKINQRKD
jgi:hypothetical protein